MRCSESMACDLEARGTGFGEVAERFGVPSVGVCTVFGMVRGTCQVAGGASAKGREVCRVTGGVPAGKRGVSGGLERGCRMSRRIIVGECQIFRRVREACWVTGRVPAGRREVFKPLGGGS